VRARWRRTEIAAHTLSTGDALDPPGRRRAASRRKLASPPRPYSLVVGLRALGLITALALLAPLIAPHDPYAQDLTRRLIPPIWYEKGSGPTRSAPTIWAATTFPRVMFRRAHLAADRRLGHGDLRLIGTTLGLVAGYFGGKTDLAITFLTTRASPCR
jgi:peptide/nickel transport system permease protein